MRKVGVIVGLALLFVFFGNFVNVSAMSCNMLSTPAICNISTCNDLVWLNNHVDMNYPTLLTYVFNIMNNLDCTGEGSMLPIGTSTKPFTGVSFNGNGYNITNLKINTYNANYQGIFGYAKNTEIKNLSLINLSISAKSYSYVGAICGQCNNVIISDVYVTGNVSGANYVGGLVGNLTLGNITNSRFTGNVTGKSYIGGLIGYASNKIALRDIIFNGLVKGTLSTSYYSIGGIVGKSVNQLIVNNTQVSGNVVGYQQVGGLVGYSNFTNITNAIVTGNVSGTVSIGGLIGYTLNNTILQDVYHVGYIIGSLIDSLSVGIGGLIGYANGNSLIVKNAQSSGNIQGYSSVGGLIGHSLSSVTILDSSSTKNISMVRNNGGGLIGYVKNVVSVVSISNSFFDGDIVANYNYGYKGGLVGYSYNSLIIANSYSMGKIITLSHDVGGLVGSGESSVSIANSYSTMILKST